MISVRPLDPVHLVGDSDAAIAHFKDSEWWSSINLVRQHGFEPPDIQRYYPQSYDHPVQIDPEAAQVLWWVISVAYDDDALPPYLQKLVRCLETGVEHGGLEIRRREHEFC